MAFSAALLVAAVGLFAGCGSSDPALRPDSILQTELGLTDSDRVHRVLIRGGPTEVLQPEQVEVLEGDWVEFVTDDWRVHEVRFELDSLAAPLRVFLEASDQVASPPMVEPGARFVLSFAEAPEGRYVFTVEGHGEPARGVVAVVPKR